MLHFVFFLMALAAATHQLFPPCGGTASNWVQDQLDTCLTVTPTPTSLNEKVDLSLFVVFDPQVAPGTLDRRIYANKLFCGKFNAVASGVTVSNNVTIVWDTVGPGFSGPVVDPTGYPATGAVFDKCHTYTEPGAHIVLIFVTDDEGRYYQRSAVVEVRDELILI